MYNLGKKWYNELENKGGGKMERETYKQFIEGIRDIADYLEETVNDSQIVDINDPVAPEDEDTIFDHYRNLYDELMSNVTGVYR